jgi:ParB family chromosome partitioning protein
MQLKDIVVSKQNVRETADEGEEFENLKASIKKDSLIHNIVLRKQKDKYEVVAGGRRFRALCAINSADYELKDSDFVLYPDMDDDQALLWSIEENTQRLAFSPLELNRAGLALNQKGLRDKEVAQKLNISQNRLKRILGLSADFNKMPDNVKEELAKRPDEAKFNDQHWQAVSRLDDKAAIKDVVDYVIEKEVPPSGVPSIIKMVETNRKAEEGTSDQSGKKDYVADRDDGESGEGGPIEYSHKGELTLEQQGEKMVFRVSGKGEDEEIPVDQYLNYLKHPTKFKCYVTFRMKVKPID